MSPVQFFKANKIKNYASNFNGLAKKVKKIKKRTWAKCKRIVFFGQISKSLVQITNKFF